MNIKHIRISIATVAAVACFAAIAAIQTAEHQQDVMIPITTIAALQLKAMNTNSVPDDVTVFSTSEAVSPEIQPSTF